MQKRLPPSVSSMNTKDESLHFRGTTFIDSTELSGLKPDNGGKSVRRLAPKAQGQVRQELAVNPFSLRNSLSMHAAVLLTIPFIAFCIIVRAVYRRSGQMIVVSFPIDGVPYNRCC